MNAQQPLLSTGEAAKLCSVERDTVLKWIKRGRLRVSCTAGGHYRIALDDLQEIAPAAACGNSHRLPATSGVPPMRCWDYFRNGGTVQETCQVCLAYRVRAARCFLLREMQGENRSSFCMGPEGCVDCPYFRRVKGLCTRVLVISSDEELRRELSVKDGAWGNSEGDFEFRFVRGAYEAATLIAEFRPGVAVVDAAVDRGGGLELVKDLVSDARNQGLKIVLAVCRGRRKSVASEAQGQVIAVLEKSFGSAALKHVMDSLAIEQQQDNNGTDAS